jgi:hypothetical protein
MSAERRLIRQIDRAIKQLRRRKIRSLEQGIFTYAGIYEHKINTLDSERKDCLTRIGESRGVGVSA